MACETPEQIDDYLPMELVLICVIRAKQGTLSWLIPSQSVYHKNTFQLIMGYKIDIKGDSATKQILGVAHDDVGQYIGFMNLWGNFTDKVDSY